MKPTLLILSLTVALSGCASITFDNGTPKTTATTTERQWHHNAAYDLLELGSPIDPVAVCEERTWLSVRTQHPFSGAVATGIATYVFGPGALLTTNLWAPQNVAVDCQEQG
ncbi:hypothetical protein [Reinekea blandensis]|uniref:Lipoprotein n=1 Tax=Reinekea blandensis MED297 TaxID=314283 RepID=A4BA32_9GAMM|nr:hypothetical protein [Reinekea blandensis]EAR10788.1 hypothetical protein MED297_09771 [Reinekea sp. MED297] [Reinekea blandensis MED297]